MSSADYLCQNRHGTFYARFVIPKQLREHFKNKKEIRRSLQTDSRKLAKKRARAVRVEFEIIIDELMSKKEKTFRVNYIEFIELSGIKTTIDTGSPEKDAEIYNLIKPSATAPPPFPLPIPTGKTISEHLDDYITAKGIQGRKGSWGGGTARQKPNKLNVLRLLFGYKPTAALSREDMEHYIKIAYAIPTNFGNPDHAEKFTGLTLDNILTNSQDLAVRSVGTVKDDLKTIRAFLSWLLSRKDVTSLQTAINALDNEIADIDYESKRRAFTEAELKTLFERDNAAPENYVKGFSKPINFWLPLIALYTGSRLAEICQLYLSDIKLVKALSDDSSYWCLDLNEDEDKNLKNKQSRRQIPIHKNLIDAGLLVYADDLRAKGETKLFPNAARTSAQFSSQSQWFGIYSGQAGIADKDTSFHSFRHCFCSHLAAHHVSEDLVAALSGHQYKSLAKSTYDRGGKRDVGKLAEVINSMDYGLNHPLYLILHSPHKAMVINE
jgi:integrase